MSCGWGWVYRGWGRNPRYAVWFRPFLLYLLMLEFAKKNSPLPQWDAGKGEKTGEK
ncbi:hypothetical protein HPT01_03405 [Providencia stuartii]|nr:hypothetical protein [Providencia stuartii]NPD40625.1 hypothetical protein [Providencia stuartii]